MNSTNTSISTNTTTRRNFLKTSLALGAAVTFADPGDLFAAPVQADLKLDAQGKPYLVYVRNGSRAAMLDKALDALGGIGRFVKKGQSVVIKPNIAWDRAPQYSANTHPELVARLVELCLKAGAKVVNVFDHTCDTPWETCYINSGVRAAVEKAGGKMINGNDETMYRLVKIPAGQDLKETKVHELILDSDVFLNVPVLKNHGGATMTAAMKNMMGAMWDRRFWHRNNLHQCIADYISLPKLRPALNIVDAYAPMRRKGPKGVGSVEDTFVAKTLLASTDIVAIDAACTKVLFGAKTAEDHIPHVKIASDAGYGTCKLGTVKVETIRITA
ncbi:MAG: DUF362 domain-containing protein [Puniceicoccales bacterium]|jgi:uncharacterized protein (DUF362 family)|nr:DUF362 domain-containing protein [Puniceicoccales bacterium]